MVSVGCIIKIPPWICGHLSSSHPPRYLQGHQDLMGDPGSRLVAGGFRWVAGLTRAHPIQNVEGLESLEVKGYMMLHVSSSIIMYWIDQLHIWTGKPCHVMSIHVHPCPRWQLKQLLLRLCRRPKVKYGSSHAWEQSETANLIWKKSETSYDLTTLVTLVSSETLGSDSVFEIHPSTDVHPSGPDGCTWKTRRGCPSATPYSTRPIDPRNEPIRSLQNLSITLRPPPWNPLLIVIFPIKITIKWSNHLIFLNGFVHFGQFPTSWGPFKMSLSSSEGIRHFRLDRSPRGRWTVTMIKCSLW